MSKWQCGRGWRDTGTLNIGTARQTASQSVGQDPFPYLNLLEHNLHVKQLTAVPAVAGLHAIITDEPSHEHPAMYQ